MSLLHDEPIKCGGGFGGGGEADGEAARALVDYGEDLIGDGGRSDEDAAGRGSGWCGNHDAGLAGFKAAGATRYGCRFAT